LFTPTLKGAMIFNDLLPLGWGKEIVENHIKVFSCQHKFQKPAIKVNDLVKGWRMFTFH
jgi:hypothetical protein